MNQKEEEYKEIFLAEALENFSEINRLLTVLEKEPNEKQTVNALFRIMHTLKGNATGMGYEKIAELAHVLEDLFGIVREGKLVLSEEIFATVYKSADVLGQLIETIKNPRDVRYRGIKTKLEIIIGQVRKNETKIELSEDAEEVSTDYRIDDDVEAKVVFSDLVQVPVSKLDNLLNLVGELVIERDRIIAMLGKNGTNEFARLNRISSDLQYSVMDVRLVQVSFLFNKFHRIVRDASVTEKKLVNLKLEGTDTEIDRNILKVISDSLIHLIRNAVGHGIEIPEARKLAGKTETGNLVLKASSDTDTVTIEITDDGAGIDTAKVKRKAIEKGIVNATDADSLSDKDLLMLIFEPGFSTMDSVNAISGRGVGMDVVKRALDSIGGTIDVSTMPGQGTRITLKLPSSMAVKSTLLFEIRRETFAIPLLFTESVISIYKSDVHKAAGGLITVHLGKTISILFLNDLFESQRQEVSHNFFHRSFDTLHMEQKLEVIVVNFNGKRLGLVVDKLLQQKEIVEKPLRKPVDHVRYVSGTTIMGNGSVCMVLNIPSIINSYVSSMSFDKSRLFSH